MAKRYETRYWNVRGLHTAGSITGAARELASYKLDVVGVKEVKWDKESTVPVEIIIFSWKRKPSTGTGFFVQYRMVPSVKKVEFVGDRTLCIVLRGRWDNIFLSKCTYTK